MKKRVSMLNQFYNQYNEDNRLTNSRQGQLEFATTMHYIRKYLKKDFKIIEIGAGTGKYSISLAKEGYDVTAVELVDKNVEILKENSAGIDNIKVYQADAIDLSKFEDNSFDITLVFGPLYHIYDKKDIDACINESIRITKPNGIILYAFLSVYAIMSTNYSFGNWDEGLKENFDEDMNILHFEHQLFTGYDIVEFEKLFTRKTVKHVSTIGVDGNIESLEKIPNFKFSDESFNSYINWHINFSEKRELLGSNSHLLYICTKH